MATSTDDKNITNVDLIKSLSCLQLTWRNVHSFSLLKISIVNVNKSAHILFPLSPVTKDFTYLSMNYDIILHIIVSYQIIPSANNSKTTSLNIRIYKFRHLLKSNISFKTKLHLYEKAFGPMITFLASLSAVYL